VSTDDFNPVARAAAEWTRAQLTSDNLEFLKSLRPGPLETSGVMLVHGAFHDEDEYVFAPAQALDGLLESPAAVTFFGHTHIQGGFAYKNNQLELLQVRPQAATGLAAVQLEPAKRYLLNPGSIGQPRDADTRAAFAIVDLDHQVVEFRRAPYDIAAVQKRMRQAGLPEPLVQRLAFGR
jgi:diadenosine tetraphosphatase ApaH/serine/threonine PP2A family protein phosphatase